MNEKKGFYEYEPASPEVAWDSLAQYRSSNLWQGYLDDTQMIPHSELSSADRAEMQKLMEVGSPKGLPFIQNVEDLLLELRGCWTSPSTKVQKALSQLSKEQRESLEKCFGLDGRAPRTFSEAAQELGRKRSGVEITYWRGLNEMKRLLESNERKLEIERQKMKKEDEQAEEKEGSGVKNLEEIVKARMLRLRDLVKVQIKIME